MPWLLTVLAMIGILTASCGGDDISFPGAPSATATPTATGNPTETPTPTPTPTP